MDYHHLKSQTDWSEKDWKTFFRGARTRGAKFRELTGSHDIGRPGQTALFKDMPWLEQEKSLLQFLLVEDLEEFAAMESEDIHALADGELAVFLRSPLMKRIMRFVRKRLPRLIRRRQFRVLRELLRPASEIPGLLCSSYFMRGNPEIQALLIQRGLHHCRHIKSALEALQVDASLKIHTTYLQEITAIETEMRGLLPP